MIALHPRQTKPGNYSTKDEHLPPNARYYLERDANWCLEKSQAIGQYCYCVVENLLTDPVRDLLRQAQLVVRLLDVYGQSRLEKVCQRAIAFNSLSYKTIHTILKEGLDYEQIVNSRSFEKLSSVYQGHAIFQRNINEFIH